MPQTGEESHLTKVLKAYYISKARSVTDLPEWLFSESERRQPQSQASGSRDPQTGSRVFRPTQDSSPSEEPSPQRSERRGLRDIYDAAASKESSVTSGRQERYRNNASGGGLRQQEEKGGTKAENRLRALRDAKRAATTAGLASRNVTSLEETRPAEKEGRPNYNDSPRRELLQSAPKRAGGLPSNPRHR